MQDAATPEVELIPVQARLLPDLHEAFAELARRNHRTIAGELRNLIEQAVERDLQA